MGLLALVVLVASSCGGDSDDRKRTEAAEWCKVTVQLDEFLDDRDRYRAQTSQIDYTQASEWTDVAPEEIRAATERAATILKQLATDPPDPELAPLREEIGAYAEENCPTPLRCIGDVEGQPRFPCH